MPNLAVRPTALKDVVVLCPKRFGDRRGYFLETYNNKTFAAAGIDLDFVQDNEAFSAKKGTVRGLHFQTPPTAQAKLVRVLRGRIFDVAVDLRVGSPTYGRWVGETLTADGAEQIFVPRGFAHGYCTLEPDTVVAYKVDQFYAPASEAGIAWNDATLGIPWPVSPSEALVSVKDQQLSAFADLVSPFTYRAPEHV
jgi:dTDP-4-dehydrorhamnose 3,5-epimerase